MKNLLDEDYNLWVLLSQTRHAMFKASQKELEQYNISPSRAAVLFVIEAMDKKPTVTEISRWVFREAHTISELLSRMERDGLVRRVKDLDKKNMVRIELTEKGRKAHSQTMKQDSISRMMSSLSKEERLQLGSYLGKLRESAFKEIGMEYEVPFPPLPR